MKKYLLKIGDKSYYLFAEASGWVIVKVMQPSGGLSRTLFRAADMDSAFQYVYTKHDGTIEKITMDDVEEIQQVQF